jgi:hypothetical protein
MGHAVMPMYQNSMLGFHWPPLKFRITKKLNFDFDDPVNKARDPNPWNNLPYLIFVKSSFNGAWTDDYDDGTFHNSPFYIFNLDFPNRVFTELAIYKGGEWIQFESENHKDHNITFEGYMLVATHKGYGCEPGKFAFKHKDARSTGDTHNAPDIIEVEIVPPILEQQAGDNTTIELKALEIGAFFNESKEKNEMFLNLFSTIDFYYNDDGQTRDVIKYRGQYDFSIGLPLNRLRVYYIDEDKRDKEIQLQRNKTYNIKYTGKYIDKDTGIREDCSCLYNMQIEVPKKHPLEPPEFSGKQNGRVHPQIPRGSFDPRIPIPSIDFPWPDVNFMSGIFPWPDLNVKNVSEVMNFDFPESDLENMPEVKPIDADIEDK